MFKYIVDHGVWIMNVYLNKGIVKQVVFKIYTRKRWIVDKSDGR